MSDQLQDFKQFMKRRETVAEAHLQGRSSSAPLGEAEAVETLHTAASHGIAYWVGLQRSKVKAKGNLEPVTKDLRITEVFRREGSDWKLVHRHSDTLVGAK